MKKIAVLFSVFVFSFSAIAGGTDADKIYKKLKESNKETFSMSLSKKMIDFFDMDLDFNGKEKLITGDFHEGRMLVIEELKTGKEVTGLFKNENYVEVKLEEEENSDEDQDEAFLFVDKKGNKVSEAHFVVINEESVVVVSVFGNIKVENK